MPCSHPQAGGPESSARWLRPRHNSSHLPFCLLVVSGRFQELLELLLHQVLAHTRPERRPDAFVEEVLEEQEAVTDHEAPGGGPRSVPPRLLLVPSVQGRARPHGAGTAGDTGGHQDRRPLTEQCPAQGRTPPNVRSAGHQNKPPTARGTELETN